MEVNTISLLENFGLISITMPYYGTTHQSFLLLSSFWTKSRMKLDDYYSEFRSIMRKYSAEIYITNREVLSTFPPFDLFKLNFWKGNIQ